MGKKIAEARQRAGMTQDQLASAVLLDRSALAKVETGLRRVSALELARIADELGERIEWFVMQAPPAIVSHRNTHGHDEATSRIDRMIERLGWNVEFVAKHGKDLPGIRVATMGPPTSRAEAESMATDVRHRLGLDDEEPFYRISEAVAKLGLLAFCFDLGRDAADAASLLLAEGGIALVNGQLQVGRRRLALVHELGHFMIADEYSIDWRIVSGNESALELRLDDFARATLLPKKGIVKFWRSAIKDATDDDDHLRVAAVKSASKFRVDMSTLSRRLRELEIVSAEEGARIRDFRTTRADIVDFNLIPEDEFKAPHMSRLYEEGVLNLFRAEVITAARATELLFDEWTEDELPELPTIPEGAIWDLI